MVLILLSHDTSLTSYTSFNCGFRIYLPSIRNSQSAIPLMDFVPIHLPSQAFCLLPQLMLFQLQHPDGIFVVVPDRYLLSNNLLVCSTLAFTRRLPSSN